MFSCWSRKLQSRYPYLQLKCLTAMQESHLHQLIVRHRCIDDQVSLVLESQVNPGYTVTKFALPSPPYAHMSLWVIFFTIVWCAFSTIIMCRNSKQVDFPICANHSTKTVHRPLCKTLHGTLFESTRCTFTPFRLVRLCHDIFDRHHKRVTSVLFIMAPYMTWVNFGICSMVHHFVSFDTRSLASICIPSLSQPIRKVHSTIYRVVLEHGLPMWTIALLRFCSLRPELIFIPHLAPRDFIIRTPLKQRRDFEVLTGMKYWPRPMQSFSLLSIDSSCILLTNTHYLTMNWPLSLQLQVNNHS